MKTQGFCIYLLAMRGTLQAISSKLWARPLTDAGDGGQRCPRRRFGGGLAAILWAQWYAPRADGHCTGVWMSGSKNLDGLFASQSEFVAYLNDFAVAKMDFDEF